MEEWSGAAEAGQAASDPRSREAACSNRRLQPTFPGSPQYLPQYQYLPLPSIPIPPSSLNNNTSLLPQYHYLPQYQYLPSLLYIFTSSSPFQHHLNPFHNLPVCYLITQSSDLCMESIQKGYFSLLLLILSLFLIFQYLKGDMTPCVFFTGWTVYTGLGPVR